MTSYLKYRWSKNKFWVLISGFWILVISAWCKVFVWCLLAQNFFCILADLTMLVIVSWLLFWRGNLTCVLKNLDKIKKPNQKINNVMNYISTVFFSWFWQCFLLLYNSNCFRWWKQDILCSYDALLIWLFLYWFDNWLTQCQAFEN